jgi:SAM-dependent methyltransferase
MIRIVKRHAPAALRNRDAILAMLRRVLPARGTVLELGSGTGEHAVFLAGEFPELTWQPSDPDPEARDSIEAWAAEARRPNLLAPLHLDLLAPAWRRRSADAILCVNVLHVAESACAAALVEGAAGVLAPGGPLVVYGPFAPGPAPLAGRLARIDATVRAADPRLGVARLDVFLASAARAGLALAEDGPGAEEGDRIVVLRPPLTPPAR